MAVRRLSQVQQHTPNPQPPSLVGKGAISPPLLGYALAGSFLTLLKWRPKWDYGCEQSLEG